MTQSDFTSEIRWKEAIIFTFHAYEKLSDDFYAGLILCFD